MTISLNQIGKRYRDTWIFKDVNYSFEPCGKYALLGANGSGKSTLLRIIAGIQLPSKGTVDYQFRQQPLPVEKVFPYLSYCAPGMDIIEEMTLLEFFRFHFHFKKLLPEITISSLLEELQMKNVQHKFIHEFSSGMKQRVKLAQAIFADTALLLLDEPCSNLDTKGVDLYHHWIKQYTTERLLIIASNDEREYQQTDGMLYVEDYR
jgi:ABC-type multidrug transport system ATPase subunit